MTKPNATFVKLDTLKRYQLNCNVFDVYDYDGLSMQELLNRFYTSINECVDVSNKTIDLVEYLVNEGLEETVAIQLDKWLHDGTLADLINVTIFKDLNEKIDNNYTELSDKITNVVETSVVALEEKLNDFGFNIKANEHMVTDNDWTLAIQTAIDKHDIVYIPSGTYKVGTVNVPSNKTVVGSGVDTILQQTETTMFSVSGSLGTQIKVTKDVSPHGQTIDVASVPATNPFDYYFILSQRDALNRTDSGKWTLGYATPNTTACYFGEFFQVTSTTATSLTSASPLTFPYYYKDNTRETSTYKRDFSTVQKVDFAENVTLKDFTIKGTGNPSIFVSVGRNVIVDNVRNISDAYTSGMTGFITFAECLDCVAVGCEYRRTDNTPPTQHHYINIFKVASSQHTTFDGCVAYNGSQPFDVSYYNDTMCSSFTTFKNCQAYYPSQTGLTSHGGTYDTRFIDNVVRGSRQGINNRSLLATITGNDLQGVMQSSTETLNYGICLYEGHARDTVISNNMISTTVNGVVISDGSGEGEAFKEVNTVITNNVMSNVLCALRTNRNNTALKDNMNILFANNVITFTTGASRMVQLGANTVGVVISDNRFLNYGTQFSGVWCDYNCLDITVRDNVIRGATDGFYVRGASSDDNAPPQASRVVYMNGNTMTNVGSEFKAGGGYIIGNRERFSSVRLRESADANANNGSIFIDLDGVLKFKSVGGSVSTITLASSKDVTTYTDEEIDRVVYNDDLQL